MVTILLTVHPPTLPVFNETLPENCLPLPLSSVGVRLSPVILVKKPGKYVLFVLLPFFLISYLFLCKGVGSTTVHSWNITDLQGSYLGWDDRSGNGHSEMKR